MALELKNLQTDANVTVDREATIGREGGGAQITVPDMAVSKKHARFFTDGSTWFVEDLGSMNGTSVNGRKIEGTEPIQVGAVIALSKHKLEVMSLGRARPAPARPAPTPEPSQRSAVNNGASEQRRRPAREVNRNQDVAAEDLAPVMPTDSRLDMRREQTPEPTYQALASNDQVSAGAAIGAAVGYYAATLPLLAINPPGTVNRSIEDQRVEPMAKMPLGFFFMPAFVGSGLIMSLAGLVSGLIVGAPLSVGPLIAIPIVMAVAAIIGGFLTHPVLTWLIDKLGGTSDERSRTNYAAICAAAIALIIVPSAAATLLSAVVAKLSASFAPISLLMIIPVLMSVVMTALVGFVGWKWMQHFQVVKWFQTLMLVLAVLGAALSLFLGVDSIKAAFAGLSSDNKVAIPTAIDPNDIEAMKAAAEAAAKAAGGDISKLSAEAKTALEAATKASADALKAAGGDVKAAVDPLKAGNDVKPTKTGDTGAGKPLAPVAPAGDDGVKTPYGMWQAKRTAVEKALSDDPTLMTNRAELKAVYKDYSRAIAAAREEVENEVIDKKTSKSEMRLFLDKAVAAKEFEKTKDMVNKMHQLLKL